MKLYLCGKGATHPHSKHTIGLGYLESNCNNVEVVINANKLNDCDIIGLSSDATGVNEVLDILEKSTCPVAIGGQISLWPEIFNYPFKHIVVGEGELALQEIMLGNAPTILTKPQIKDIDVLNFPSRRFYDNKIFCITSRGCPFHCNFCSSTRYWKGYRYHSAEYLMDDITQAYKKYKKAKFVHIIDDLFLVHKKRLHEIKELWMSKGFHRKLKFFNISIRPQFFDEESLRTLLEMGLQQLRIGIESVSPNALKILGKNQTLEQIQNVLDLVTKYKVKLVAYFMYGIPNETKHDLELNKKFIENNSHRMNVQYRRFQSLPGCELWDKTSPLSKTMEIIGNKQDMLNEIKKKSVGVNYPSPCGRGLKLMF